MIKKGIYILSTALVLGCGACDDWLTVVPETALVADNLFETDGGCLKVLDGAYVLAATNIYAPEGYVGGGGFSEFLACTWTSTNQDLANHVYNLDNESFSSSFDMVFQAFYRIINSLNPMIDGMEENRDKLSEEYYNIIKGEALAMRASLHLDLMRLWGPMPTQVDASRHYLPYVRHNSIDNYAYSTFEEFMGFVLADLNEAEELLLASDPIVTYPADGSDDYTGDWTERKAHFNYYGVLGLQARARLWMGDREGAMRYAQMVIDAKNEDGTPKFTLASADNIGSRIFYVEHLCGINQDSYDYQQHGFANINSRISYYNANYNSFMGDLFDGNMNDLRYREQWSYIRPSSFPMNCRITRKYEGMYPSSTAPKNFPVVRLAEMYLTIMEAGTLEEANAAYQTLCTARNVDYVALTESNRNERVMMEWVRELIAEGQNFFTYKRYAVERMLWQPAESLDCGEEQYVLPLPNGEMAD